MEKFFEGKFIVASEQWHCCYLCGAAIPSGMSYWQERDPEDCTEKEKCVCLRCYRLRNELVEMTYGRWKST